VVIKYYSIIVINNILRDDTSLQGYVVMSFGKVTIVLDAVIVSQTLVPIYKLAWHCIPGNLNLRHHCFENLRLITFFLPVTVFVVVGISYNEVLKLFHISLNLMFINVNNTRMP
jgi:hypothetical protein